MLVRGERFNQPLFGSNNLSMNVASTNGWGSANEFSVKFEFRKGGAQTFLRIFWRVMSSVNDTRNIPGMITSLCLICSIYKSLTPAQ